MLMYVGDVLCVASTKNVDRVLEEIQKIWRMSIKRIIIRDGGETKYAVPSIERFLGCTIEPGNNEESKPIIKLHQIGYIKEKLRERALDKTKGRCGLPESMEGKVEPAIDRATPEYLEMKKNVKKKLALYCGYPQEHDQT